MALDQDQAPICWAHLATQPGARIFPGSALSHSDCAEVLIKAASEPTWLKQFVNCGH